LATRLTVDDAGATVTTNMILIMKIAEIGKVFSNTDGLRALMYRMYQTD